MPVVNDNSIKQGFVIPVPTVSNQQDGYFIKVTPNLKKYHRDYLIIQNLSSTSPFYISFHKPKKSFLFGNFCEEGMIELMPKQAWQDYPEDVHQGDVYIFINKPPVPETMDENNNPNGAFFASVNYNGAFEFFINELKPSLPPIYD